MYNDLQDALGYRTDQNAPFNPVYSVGSATTPFQVSSLPIDPTAPPPTGTKLVPGGVQPDMRTPTLISWSLRVQQEVSPNTSLTVGYVGSHGYHALIGIDANEPFPVICPASPYPATYPNVPTLGPWLVLRFLQVRSTYQPPQGQMLRSPTRGRGSLEVSAITTRFRWM